MGKSGIITEEFKGEENTSYHDIIALFKIYVPDSKESRLIAGGRLSGFISPYNNGVST